VTSLAANAFQTPRRDLIFTPKSAPINDATASGFQRGVDVFGSGLGFVYDACLMVAAGGVGSLKSGIDFCTD